MNTNKRNDNESYDVSTYSDEELYDILDLSNPTDRELEAKIIFLYRKYQNMQNSSGNQLAKFFNDIYNHFFENNEESEVENEEIESDSEIVKEGMTTLTDVKKSEDIEKPRLDISVDNRTFTINEPSSQTSAQTVNYVKQLDYATDNLNPLLQQTITRVISIDSQYRADKTGISTEFTFDLSDPLKDVVSLSLYSVQIPYTWYTIAKSYGSNFFYIKGNSPGINNGNHDIKIAISAGNYSPTELVTAVNSSIISNYSVYSDISLASTNITYNQNTSLSTINVGLTNQYNENSYDLSFGYWTTPNLYDTSGNLDDVARSRGPYASISSFLGFNQKIYLLNTLNSGLFTPSDISTNSNFVYKIDPSSTTFKIIKYISNINNNQSELYKDGISKVTQIIPITLSLSTDGTKYSRNEIITDLSIQLHNNIYLSNESSISLIYASDVSDIRYGNSYYQLKIKPNRYTTTNITNEKVLLQFPDESTIASSNTKLWTGNTSCFRFSDLSNEIQLIKSETPIVKQTNVYTVLQGPYVTLKCVNPNFISVANDISFALQPNQVNGTNIYTVSQLIDSINAGIILETIKNPFLNGPPPTSILTYTYDPTTDKPPNYTVSYVDTNYTFSLALEIEKDFDNNNYYINFQDTSFNSLFKLGKGPTGPITNSSLTHLTGITNTFDKITINTGSILFYVYPIQDMCGNELDNIGSIRFNNPTITFYDYASLSNTITSYLINFTYQGNKLFTNDTTFTVNLFDNQHVEIKLNLFIIRRIISKDYTIQFIDNVNAQNFWKIPLNIGSDINISGQVPFIDSSYNLAILNSNYLTGYTGSNSITVKASEPITTVSINFDSARTKNKLMNVFRFHAEEDGVYSKNGENDIVITLPIDDSSGNLINYTRDLMISTINSLLAKDPRSIGTHLYLTEPDIYYNYNLIIRPNINKIFTATDYKLVFYDTISFVKCFVGAKGVQNTTWDSTLGWILGFRNSTYYKLNQPDGTYILSGNINNVVTVISDTAVSTNLYNYFLICLDDYNLNHLNDGLVTITGQDTSVSLPSYADRSNFQCDPTTNKLTYNANSTSANDKNSQLTQNQLYSITQKANAKNATTSNILGGQSATSYGRGPFSEDVFAVIPMKLAGLQNGSYFVEFGGTLQNNNRYYFGPVNIHRMKVRLISDKGNTVDLNGTNWSFSFLCQQLYKQKNKPSKK